MRLFIVVLVTLLGAAVPAQAQLFGAGQDSGVREQFAVGFPTTTFLVLLALVTIAVILLLVATPTLVKSWIENGVKDVVISNKDYTAERVAEQAWGVVRDQLGTTTSATVRQFESANETVKRQFESTNKRLDEIAEQVQRLTEVYVQSKAKEEFSK
jgi:hypothetical protein